MKHYKYIILLIFVFNSIIAQVTIKEAFPNLSFSQIVDIQSAKNGINKLFIVSQPGYIYSGFSSSCIIKPAIHPDTRRRPFDF